MNIFYYYLLPKDVAKKYIAFKKSHFVVRIEYTVTHCGSYIVI